MKLQIRSRLTLLFAILVALVLLGAGAFVHIRFRQDLRNAVDSGLRSRAQTMLAEIDDAGLSFGDEGNLIEADAAFAQIVGSDGQLFESSAALKHRLLVPSATLARLRGPTYFDVTLSPSGEAAPARVLAAPSGSGYVVIVGASLEEQNEAAARLATALLVGGAGALAITALIGWLVTGAALGPVERMRAEAAGISGDEFGRRLDVPNTGDELARLADTLNDMLGRLEQAIEHERRFVDDASHELRTPLGILKTELELALRKARTPEELEAALRSAAEESDRLNSLAEDLLVLARSDRGKLPVHREDTDLQELINDVVARFQVAAEDRGVSIDPGGAPYVRADIDPARLRQALGNLVDNSIRHSPPGSLVTIATKSDEAGLRLEVADQGPGFSAEFLPRAFDAFARSDAGRTRSDGGAGLGLTIVKAVAEAHGGSVVAANRADGGAVVAMVLPYEPGGATSI
ncbi:MAG: two-component system, OmpR family, sensor kinase [Actinomycetota bacterium]|jgi:heavy metal sensor kinase|nr:two-component system, OmpR family, sensor kinase [Actinomycetota bacterium]